MNTQRYENSNPPNTTHTNSHQTDTTDSQTSERKFLYRDGDKAARQVERGFASEAVRDPEGAIDFDAAVDGWEEFVQKVRMGNLSVASELTDEEALRTVTNSAFDSMLHAATFITETEAAGKIISYDGTVEVPVDPRALSILADTALAEPTVPHLPTMRTDPTHRIIPQQQQQQHHNQQPQQPQQHQMSFGPISDPRTWILPRPTPTQQPRRLLPARAMGLPDPFAMNGPPQLPPPPGSNFARLPMPGYLPPPGHPSAGHPSPSHPPAGHPPTGHPPTGHPSAGHPSAGHPSAGHPPTHAPGPGHPPPGHAPQGHGPPGHGPPGPSSLYFPPPPGSHPRRY